jgi:hypothetical protein
MMDAEPGAVLSSLENSIARTVVLKLSAGGHGRQRSRTAEDLRVQRIALERVGREVIHILARRQNLITQLLHAIEFVAEQLKSASIRSGGHCDRC